MGNVNVLQRITGNFMLTASREYDVITMYNLGELQKYLEELQRIVGNIACNLRSLQRIMGELTH